MLLKIGSIFVFFFFAFICSFQIGLSQSTASIKALPEPIVFDGKVDDPAWQNIEPFEVFQQNFNNGQVPTENSDIRISHDDHYMYIGARLYDKNPELIQYPSRQRDELSLSNDWFGLILDSFDDNENGFGFFTTPSGLRLDMVIEKDGYGDFPINTSWNTFWDVKTNIDEEGWSAEFRIPLSSIKFQNINGVTKMGLIFWRLISRKNEINTWPIISNESGWWSCFRPSLAGTIQLQDVKPKSPVYITPYVLAGYRRSYILNDAGTNYENNVSPKIEPGLDLKYNLTSNLTLDASINTDFAQVEADDQQINLTRSALFFPEKRPFFQERASVFDARAGGGNRLFYSRRIGLDQNNLPLRILGGVRVTGRMQGHDIGFINMQTGPNEWNKLNDLDTDSLAALNTENFTVMRVRKNLFNPRTNIGAMLTHRINWNGNFNTLYGLDGVLNLRKNDFLKFAFVQTRTDGLENNPLALEPTRVYINFERFQYSGFVYDFAVNYVGKDYNPSMGFESRENYLGAFLSLKYGWIPKDHAFINRYQARIYNFVFNDNDSRMNLSNTIGLSFELHTNIGYEFSVNVNQYYERVFETLEFSDKTFIPEGDYNFRNINLSVSSPEANFFGYAAELELGSFYDGYKYSLEIEPRQNFASGFVIGGTYQFNRLEFAARDQLENIQIIRLKLLYMLNIKWSVSGFVQYNNVGNVVLGNFRLRYNPKEGTDIYLVYNEDFNTNGSDFTPHLPLSNERLILLKATYTLQTK